MYIFTMMRSGVFVPAKATRNQCAREGHPAYNYRIIVATDASLPLNEREMILDHILIDDMMMNMKLSGSCEEMLKAVLNEVKSLFSDFEIKLLGAKIDIYPSMVESFAHISLNYTHEELGMYTSTVMCALNN
jgi:hypothetical protein